VRIIVYKLTDVNLMRKACSFTMNHRADSNVSLRDMYNCRHSPMRTQLFVVLMYEIPTSASVHLVRHSAVGQQHYVGSNRPDRGSKVKADRDTPVDHMMILNAQHLEEMSWDRLCGKAERATKEVMLEIKYAVGLVDEDLADKMVPRCKFLGRCLENKPCGVTLCS